LKGKDPFPALLLISGPTGSGKSALAESLSAEFDLPILSADSRQVYRYFEIGTAKPDKEILQALPYEMIDILEPEEKFSAGKFAARAADLIEHKYRSSPVVIIAGGTGFYISALLEGLADIPDIVPEMDQKWDQFYAEEGLPGLQRKIKQIDPLFYEKGNLENPQRLIRALKVADQTGKSLLNYEPVPFLRKTTPRLEIAIQHERPVLYERINQRVDKMVEHGLIEEAENLLKYRDTPAWRTVGYRELLPYFDGETPLKEAIEKIKQHTRNYAKRQMTWFHKHGNWQWITPGDDARIREWIVNQLQ